MDAMGTMRDLDQIREHDDPGNSSRLMSIALGGLATACVLFAVGVMVGRESGDTRTAPHDDPLARLDALAHPPEAPAAPVTYPERLVGTGAVTPVALVVPGALGVAGAPGTSGVRGAATSVTLGTAPGGSGTDVSPGATAAQRLDPTARPVLVASAGPMFPGNGIRIHDTLSVAGTAGTTGAPRPPASVGSDGPFTVQVSSFHAAGSAQAFAQRLRERGHRAYVAAPATAPNGAVWYRVRVGPFTSLREASAYRGEFESHERMPAIVVRRDTQTDRE